MEKKWAKNNIPVAELNRLMAEHGFCRPIAMTLAARGVTSETIEEYINASLKSLSSPYRIPGTEAASKRLWDAIRNEQRILIHGDFDADGITATGAVSWVLSENGAKVSCFIPHRFDDGYGFTPESLMKALNGSTSDLLVTVDCGITSVEAVAKAKSMGIDVIITDHHEPGSVRPDAFALINTKLYPELSDLHCLAGVGTAFKLSHAFIKYGTENGLISRRTDLRDGLDLVALGTVADIVPLLNENRILTRHGLKALSKQIRPGVRALCEISGISSTLKPSDVAFKLVPRINAAGRLGDPNLAYKLLETNSIVEATRLAGTLEDYNRQRQAKEEEIFNEAQLQIRNRIKVDEAFSILISGENWHQGVIGNVASRIARDYNRPAIVLTIIGDEAYGSGRSPNKGNLVDILSECADILLRYGGHPMAVGLSIKREHIDALFRRFELSVSKSLTREDLTPQIDYDGDALLSEFDDAFFADLDKLEPFGHSNPQPVYRITGLDVPHVTPAGVTHSRGYVRDRTSKSMPFIAFNTSVQSLPAPPWDILTIPQINEHRGNIYQQLQIIDVKSS